MHQKTRLAVLCLALLGLGTAITYIPAACAKPASSAPLQIDRNGTVMTLPVTAAAQVDNDEALLQFFVLETHRDLQHATAKVLERMTKGINALKAGRFAAEFQTEGMQSYPRYGRGVSGQVAKIESWEVRQSLSVRVTDVTQVGAVAQLAASHFGFEGVSFSVSERTREAVQENLMRTALESVRRQAAAVASALGATPSKVRIESLDWSASDAVSGPVYARNALKASMDGAVLEGAQAPVASFEVGKTRLTRRVTAKLRIVR
ncbi:MAG: SIMPL domain-containing protein [Duodenibacillus sp.]